MKFFDRFRGRRPAATPAPARASVVDTVMNSLSGMGGYRDKSVQAYYAPVMQLSPMELEFAYRSSWTAARVVNQIAEDMTREWRSVAIEGDDGTQVKAVAELEAKLRIQSVVTEALRWARLYGGALLVLGVGPGDRNLNRPLNPDAVRRGDLKWLRVIAAPDATQSTERIEDPAQARFGEPAFYQLPGGQIVHWTRTIRFDGQKLPPAVAAKSALWPDSELQRVLSVLLRYDGAMQAIDALLQEASVDVIKTPELGAKLAANGEAAITKRFGFAAMGKSIWRALVLDKDEDYAKVSPSFAGLDSVMLRYQSDVAGAAGVPIMILFGQSAGGLGSTGQGETRTYYDGIAARQNAQLRPSLEALDQVLVRSALGNMPADYSFTFVPLWQQSETERATNRKTEADTDAVYLSNGVLTEAQVARELVSRGTYATLSQADADALEDLQLEPGDTDLMNPDGENEEGDGDETKPSLADS